MSKSDEEIVEAIQAVIFDEIRTAYERNWRRENAKDLIENIECGPIARAVYRVARTHVLDEAAQRVFAQRNVVESVNSERDIGFHGGLLAAHGIIRNMKDRTP